MKLTGWKRKLNGEKFGEGNGGPRLHLSARSFSNVEFSHGITYNFGVFWELQDVVYAKKVLEL